MDYPDWANDHADEFEAIKAEMQELAVEMLAKKTYTFYEEFVDELFDIMRDENKEWGLAIIQPRVASPEIEKIGLQIDLEEDTEDEPRPYMKLGLNELIPVNPFKGILLPFRPSEYMRCRFYKDDDGMIFDVPEMTYSLRTAVNCAGFWMTSEHNWDANTKTIVRRAYRCAMDNDPLGKIFAIAMRHSNASPAIQHWETGQTGHWSLDPRITSICYERLNEFDMAECWREPRFHLDFVRCKSASWTTLIKDYHVWGIELDALTMNPDQLMEVYDYDDGWYQNLSIIHPSCKFTKDVIEEDYAKLRAFLKQDHAFPFRELLDYIFDGKWLE